MVAPSKFRQVEGSGRDHQVPVRESTRPRHGHSRQPSIRGLEFSIMYGLLKTDELESYLEPILRRVVRPVVERIIQEYLFPSTTPCEAGTSGAKPLELRFMNEPSETTFTYSDVKAKDEETPLMVALYDVRSQSVVSDGPLSSAKVEIFALDGDFCSKRREDWTEEEFNANIQSPREGKEPLLKGDDRIITLKNGVGCITQIKITDNSRWMSSGKFSLGAKVLKLTSCGEGIKEGVSKPFRVKDNRGELYKKHHPPKLNDDLWRLEKISKTGVIYQRLCDHGIRTVKDFLRSYNIDSDSLKNFGRIPGKSWKAITEHVKECDVDDHNLYMYQTSAEKPVGLFFNSVYNLEKVTFDSQTYLSPDSLAPYDKIVVENAKQHAYKNLKDLKSVGDQTSINFQGPLTNPQAGQASGPDQGQIETFPGSDQPFPSYAFEEMQNYQIYPTPFFPDSAPMLQNDSAEDGLFPGMQIEGNGWSNFISPWTLNENQHIEITNWGQEDVLHFNSHGGAQFGIGTSEKPKVGWYRVLTALKWVISIRMQAAKRMQN